MEPVYQIAGKGIAKRRIPFHFKVECIMKIKRLVLTLSALAVAVPALSLGEVYYTWQGTNGIRVYSDTSKLDADGVVKVEGGTGFSTYVAPKNDKKVDTSKMSIEEKKLLLDQEILEERKKRQEKAEKQKQEERKNNCNIAKLNLTAIQSAERAANRDELIAQYQQEIKRFCD